MQRASAITGGLLRDSTRLVWLDDVERKRTDRGQHNKHTNTASGVLRETHAHGRNAATISVADLQRAITFIAMR